MKVEPEAYLDTYYMWDFQRTPKRSFTTRPIRHQHPLVNLAHLGARITSSQWRSKVILQAGDSLERNAALEPGKEKYIQEAFIGMESWISKDNPTHSRSLMLDYVPYYSAGLRLDHTFSEQSGFQFHLMQGRQIISETNHSKALGLQYRWKILPIIILWVKKMSSTINQHV